MEQASVTPRPVALEMARTFSAPRERVFRAWTDAAELACWFAPSPDYKIVIPELELRVGGRYVIEMHHPNGNVHRVGGTYRDIQPPEKISFTWQWEGNANGGETLVTVAFRELGSGTQVQLTHEFLPNTEARAKHQHGWIGCFDRLAGYL